MFSGLMLLVGAGFCISEMARDPKLGLAALVLTIVGVWMIRTSND